MGNTQEMNAPIEGDDASNEELVEHPGAEIRPDLFKGQQITREEAKAWTETRNAIKSKFNTTAASNVHESLPFGETANFLTEEEMKEKVENRELEDKR